jgi:hypothetical protein
LGMYDLQVQRVAALESPGRHGRSRDGEYI